MRLKPLPINLLFRVFLPLYLVYLGVYCIMCYDKIFGIFLVLRYSSLHYTHYSYFYSHSLHLWSLLKRGIFVNPPFCPRSICGTKCLPILLFWLVVIPWWPVDTYIVSFSKPPSGTLCWGTHLNPHCDLGHPSSLG